jgi:UDP-glucose 4-epimerase
VTGPRVGRPADGLRGDRVLVTGGLGFIGRAVVDALLGAGADVVVADREPHPDPRVESLVGDLRDPAFVDRALTPGLAGVIHLAAVTSVLRSKEDPAGTYEANVAVTANLLDRARLCGVGQFVMSSTNAVVGDVGNGVIDERLPLQPLTPYGATKAACEMLLSGYAASYDMACASLRFTNVYGPGMGHKDSFVPRLMRAALHGHEADVYGDGLQMRDLVHVRDIAEGVLLAWRRRHVGPLILGSGHSVTVNDMVAAARRVTLAPIPVRHVEPQAGEMPAVVVDISRARLLGFRPRVDIDAGFASVWDDFCGRGRAEVRTR